MRTQQPPIKPNYTEAYSIDLTEYRFKNTVHGYKNTQLNIDRDLLSTAAIAASRRWGMAM